MGHIDHGKTALVKALTGTDTGFGVRLDWTRRYAGQRGQNFTAGAESVEERNRLAGDLSYIIPLQPLDGGRATVAGFDVATQPRQVRRVIGVAGQSAAVDEMLTGADTGELSSSSPL